MNNRTYYFSPEIFTDFLHHFSLEPARILDFLAPMIYVNIINRQTNILNFIDLTQAKTQQQISVCSLSPFIFHNNYNIMCDAITSQTYRQ